MLASAAPPRCRFRRAFLAVAGSLVAHGAPLHLLLAVRAFLREWILQAEKAGLALTLARGVIAYAVEATLRALVVTLGPPPSVIALVLAGPVTLQARAAGAVFWADLL